MQGNGAELLRLACCLGTERGVEIVAPVHDAVLICARLDRLAAVDAAALVSDYRAGTATVEVDGAPVALEDGDLIVTETPREGWTVASGGGLTVALDLTLTPELERAGLVREVIRLVQEARKNSGLEVTDRIELWWVAEDEQLRTALGEHTEEVLAELGLDPETIRALTV